MRQMNIFDESLAIGEKTNISKRLFDNKLNTVEYDILDYLKSNCVGKDNAIQMKELALLFRVDARIIRKYIERIRKNKPNNLMIASGNSGYWIPLESESKEANGMLLSRILGAIETAISNDPNSVLAIYKHLNTLNKKLDKPIQNQLILQLSGYERELVNYYGDKYIKKEEVR